MRQGVEDLYLVAGASQLAGQVEQADRRVPPDLHSEAMDRWLDQKHLHNVIVNEILLTGNRGAIGRVVETSLRQCGYGVRTFDIQDGDDVRDLPALRRAMRGCGAVVHTAALIDDEAGSPEEIIAVNLGGTSHVLQAAREAGAERVVYFSSLQALGVAKGQRAPDYFPIDDDHPLYASRPYGIAKRLAEGMCELFTEATGITTVCLRPAMVCDPGRYAAVASQRAREPSAEWEPFWEYGAYIDVRDVAAAVECALAPSVTGHHRLLLTALDAWTSAPSRQMAHRLLPAVPWRGGSEYAAEPQRSLVDVSRAIRVLGWTPRYSWAEQVSR
jgi:nucleoside-diphosphate-sugar epimerase